MDYICQFLQPQRISGQNYIHSETTELHNKTMECIWNSPECETWYTIYHEEDAYYQFCNKGMGSNDDLLAVQQSIFDSKTGKSIQALVYYSCFPFFDMQW